MRAVCCAVCECETRMRRLQEGRNDAGTRGSGRGTYANKSKGAARVDRDATGGVESGASADGGVIEAIGAARERGCCPRCDVDTADAIVQVVLQYTSSEGHIGDVTATPRVVATGIASAEWRQWAPHLRGKRCAGLCSVCVRQMRRLRERAR